MSNQAVIKVSELNISPAYQRTVKRGVVSKIKKSFDKSAFGTLVVGIRDDGSKWVIDGQQRMTAIKEMGHVDVPCTTIESCGSAHEARIFRLINGGRQNISRNELFKAALESGDSQSVEIVAAVERMGFVLMLNAGSNRKSNVISQAAPLKKIYEWGKVPLVELVLQCVNISWAGDQSATKSFVLTGLGKFFRMYPAANIERVEKCLAELSPNQMLRHAEDARQLMGGNRDLVVSRVVAMQYNKRLKPKNRLAISDASST